MVIVLPPKLEEALNVRAKQRGLEPETLAVELLDRQLSPLPEPQDEWERQLFSIGIDCGVSPSDRDLSREALND